MRASVLKAFMLGDVESTLLAADLTHAFTQTGVDTRRLNFVDDLAEDFPVSVAYLARICDAVLSGAVPAEALEAIGFAMIASDHFIWDPDEGDGSRVAETLNDWSAPEINFALRADTVAKFRHRLPTGEDLFTRDDHSQNVSRRAARKIWQSGSARP